MKMTQLKLLEKQLDSSISDAEKGAICLQLVADYSIRYSLNFHPTLKKGLQLKNIKPEDKLELLFFQLNSEANQSEKFSKTIETIESLIAAHPFGQEKTNRLDSIKTKPSFRKREYETTKELCLELVKSRFNSSSISEYDLTTKASLIYLLAWSEKLTGSFQESLNYFDEHRKLCEQLNNPLKIATNYDNVANLFANDKNFEKAHVFMEESLKVYQEHDLLEYATKTYLHIAGNYMNMGKLEEAIQFYNKTIELAENNNDLVNRIFSWNNLSRISIMQEDVEGFQNFRRILEKHKDFILKDRVTAISFCRQSTEGFLKFKQLDKALYWSDQFEFYQSSAKNNLDLERIYNLKIEIYKQLKDKEKQMEYQEKFLDLKDAILVQAKRKAVEEFEAKFQNQQKESRIQELKLESVSFQLQSLRAQMNPHFVFNTIASITEKLEPNNIETSKILLRNFARLMRSNLNFAEQDKISLEEEIQFLSAYLSLQQNSSNNSFNFQINYSSELDLDFIDIPSMIIQPYVENAIKHGVAPLIDKDGLITISFEELNEEFLICTIRDNGVGRKEAAMKKQFSNHESKSTKITEQRLNLLNASNNKNLVHVVYKDLEDERVPLKGTEVIIQIQL